MGIIETITMLAKEEGIEQGIERGIEQGVEQGIEKGIERGRELEKIAIVRNLLIDTDFDIFKIAVLAGVEDGFVTKIKMGLKS